MRRWITLFVGVCISAFFAWLGFRELDFAALGEILGEIHVIWLMIGTLVFLLAVYIITWRWYFLLQPVKDVKVSALFPIVIIGYMGNNIYPARIGEFIRAYILKRNEGVRYVPSLTTILVERIFDGLVMLTFIMVALLFVDIDEPVIDAIIQVTVPLFFGALLVFSIVTLRPEASTRVFKAMIALLPNRLQNPLHDILDHIMDGLSALRQPQLLVLTWLCSFATWIVEASVYWFVLQAFDFSVTFWVLMLLIGVANLTTILPSTPGYVGTFHGVVVIILTAFDVAGEQAGAYAITVHLVLWLPITLLGFALLWRQGMGWRELGQASRMVESEAVA